MKVNEFKIHVMRGLLRPEYFYIPLFGHNHKMPVRFKFTDEFGDDVFVSGFTLTYNKYTFTHDSYKGESGYMQYVYDEYPKGYAFNEDCEWRFPVPDPSLYEVYPVPDLTAYDITAKNGTVEKGSETVYITFDVPQTLAELENLPAGAYYVNVPAPAGISYFDYYPGYYTDEYAFVPDDSVPGFDPGKEWHKGDLMASNGVLFVCQYDYKPGDSVNSGLFRAKREDYPVPSRYPYGMIDRNGAFSGWYYKYIYDSASYSQLGYNFYGITKKFENNTMPVVAYYPTYTLTLKKTDEYNRHLTGAQFRLHVHGGGDSIQLNNATLISRTSDDIVFETAGKGIVIRNLKVVDEYALYESIPENFIGYEGAVSFHYTKMGELICGVQNEYVSHSGNLLTIKNKRAKHRVRIELELVSNPLLPGGYYSTVNEAVPMSPAHAWWPYNVPVEPPLYFSGIVSWHFMCDTKDASEIYPEYFRFYYDSEGNINGYDILKRAYLRDSASYVTTYDMRGNKCAIVKIYLDDVYQGYYTNIEMTQGTLYYEYGTIGEEWHREDGTEGNYSPDIYGFSDNWNSYSGGTDPLACFGGTFHAYRCRDTDKYHYFSEQHDMVMMNPGKGVELYYGDSGVRGDYLFSDGLVYRDEKTIVDPLSPNSESSWCPYENKSGTTITERWQTLVPESVRYNGGESASINIRVLGTVTKNGKVTDSYDTVSSVSCSLSTIAANLAYYEAHPEELYQTTTVYGNPKTITRFLGEGLTSSLINEIIAITAEEDMEINI